jgi:hypothetical protein
MRDAWCETGTLDAFGVALTAVRFTAGVDFFAGFTAFLIVFLDEETDFFIPLTLL